MVNTAKGNEDQRVGRGSRNGGQEHEQEQAIYSRGRSRNQRVNQAGTMGNLDGGSEIMMLVTRTTQRAAVADTGSGRSRGKSRDQRMDSRT